MSTSEEISAVYNHDIAHRARCVFNKSGIGPFYDGLKGFRIESLHDGLGADYIVCKDFTPRSKKKCQ